MLILIICAKYKYIFIYLSHKYIYIKFVKDSPCLPQINDLMNFFKIIIYNKLNKSSFS